MNVTTSTSTSQRSLRPFVGAVVATIIIVITAIVAVCVSVITLFHARRFVMDVLIHWSSRLALWVTGVDVEVVGEMPWRGALADRQLVYVFNHTSSLDLFVVCALGLPRVRTLMKRKFLLFVPMGILGLLSGTFFTPPQSMPQARTRLFQRITRALRDSDESVFLSPEGTRVTTGKIGHFNKGAFHLAAALQAPMVPLLFVTPPQTTPGTGLLVGRGVVQIHVLPTIDTSAWTQSDDSVCAARDSMHDAFASAHAAVCAARCVVDIEGNQ